MRALVTGGTGFIGSHLVAALRRLGHSVLCLVRRKVVSSDPGIKCQVVDLADQYALCHLLDKMDPYDVIFHFGARLPVMSNQSSDLLSHYVAVNVASTAVLLEAAKSWKTCSFVYASGLPIIGKPVNVPVTERHPANPTHPYLLSKYQAELACEFFRKKGWVQATSLRISSPYGPGMNPRTVLPLFVRLALESNDIQVLGTGDRTQNFVHVSDVVQAALLAAETSNPGVYNVASKCSTSMSTLAREAVAAAPGSKSRILLNGEVDPQDDYRWEIDLKKAFEGLGYRPNVDLSEGLKDYISWFREKSAQSWWRSCD